MFQIAVIEDDLSYQKLLQSYVQRFFESQGDAVCISLYSDGADFLESPPDHVDLILLDIDMPRVNGLETARQIRSTDQKVLIIFVTNLIQCALDGYTVDAMDFIVKPVSQAACFQSLSRARKKLLQNRDYHIQVSCQKNTVILHVNDILYAETQNHSLLLHCRKGDLVVSESMQTLEGKLSGFPFFRCHNSFLVNLSEVERIGKTDVYLGSALIPISKYRRPDFLKAMAAYMGGMK